MLPRKRERPYGKPNAWRSLDMSFIQIIEDDERFELAFNDSALLCRRVSRQKVREIERRHTRMRFRPGGVQAPVVDDEQVADDLLDYCIVDWHGVVDSRGEAVLCERKYKLLLPPSVLNEVMTACVQQVTARTEAKEKGADPLTPSGGGSASGSTSPTSPARAAGG